MPTTIENPKPNDKDSAWKPIPMDSAATVDAPTTPSEVADPLSQEDAPPISRSAYAKKKISTPVVAIIGAVVLIAIFAILFKHPDQKGKTKTKDPTTLQAPPAQTTPPTAPVQGGASSLPTDKQAQIVPAEVNSNTTPADILHTRADKGVGKGGDVDVKKEATPIGAISQFQTPQGGAGANQWQAPAYNPNGNSSNPAPIRSSGSGQSRLALLTKASMVFFGGGSSANSQQAHVTSTAPPLQEERTITNLGYAPGFHIEAHLEIAASTAIHVPVLAVVDYPYRRNGKVIIPAGSRASGEMTAATSTGIVGITFSSLRMPNGEEVPISAIALNQRMAPLKGIVTGRNLGKQFLLAAVSGLGQAASSYASASNSGAISEADVMKSQAAQNVGSKMDTEIQKLGVSENLIVTLRAGTQIELTFTAATKRTTSTKQ